MPQIESGKPEPGPTAALLLSVLPGLQKCLKRRRFSDFVAERAIDRVLHQSVRRDQSGNAPRNCMAWLFVSALEAARQEASREAPCSFLDPIVFRTVAARESDTELPAEFSAALGQLRPQQRETVLLCVVCGMPVREVAAVMGRASSTVSRNRELGLARLRVILADYETAKKIRVNHATEAPLYCG